MGTPKRAIYIMRQLRLSCMPRSDSRKKARVSLHLSSHVNCPQPFPFVSKPELEYCNTWLRVTKNENLSWFSLIFKLFLLSVETNTKRAAFSSSVVNLQCVCMCVCVWWHHCSRLEAFSRGSKCWHISRLQHLLKGRSYIKFGCINFYLI